MTTDNEIFNTTLTLIPFLKTAGLPLLSILMKQLSVSDQISAERINEVELAEPLPDDITEAEKKRLLAFLSYYS